MADPVTEYKINKCVLVPSEGSSLKEEYDILGGDPRITYCESILSPAISVAVNFFDRDQVVSRYGLTGGEYIQIEVDSRSDSLGKFEITSDHNMIINRVRDVQTDVQGQMATLEAVPSELLTNETAKITKKFSGNIADTVKDIMTTDVKGIQTSKKLDEESSANKYSFVGNYKRPIDIVQWLQPKASVESEEGESYGFLFWETLDGYHFKSIETLLAQEPIGNDKYLQVQLPLETYQKLLDATGDPVNDTIMSLRKGMYANTTIYVDLETHIKTVDEFTIKDLGLEKPPKLPEGIDEKPTKLMFRVIDPGAMQKDSKKVDGDESATEKQQDLAKYQNKSYARNSLLFSNTFNVSIPFNPKMRAGLTIEINFPLPDDNTAKSDRKEAKKFGTEKDDDPSGIYLIEGLRHDIGGGSAVTQLSLIRDSFTA